MNIWHILLFVVFAVVMWLLMNYFSAKSSGWSNLASRYCQYVNLGDFLDKKKFVSMNVGKSVAQIRFTSSTCVEVYSKGISIYPIAVFSPFKERLFFPWESLCDVEEKDNFFYSFNFQAKGAWPKISVFGDCGKQCAHQWKKYGETLGK